jgi:hypothetical protein
MDRHEATLDALGEEYLEDPAIAPQLLHALLHCDDADAIDQAWLNRHWDDPRAINLLVDIHDFWGRCPQPLGTFLQDRWDKNDTAWHFFVDSDLIDGDPALAARIYQQLAREGPTDKVLETMCGLRHSPESDHYADIIMPGIINRADASPDLLRLWHRYGPVDGVGDRAIGGLLRALDCAPMRGDAVRVVQRLQMMHLPRLIGALVQLAAAPTGCDSRRARRILVRVSDTHLGVRIAKELPGVPWCAYMASFHHRTLWHMMDYMLEQREVPTMQAMWNTYMGIGLDVGLFTRLQCLGVQVEAPSAIGTDPPAGVHAAIYYMHVRGVPPPDISLFHWAHREWPAALQHLSRHPAIRRELNWARRRGLLLALVRRYGTATGTLGRLQDCEAIWPVVMGFM